MDAQPLASCTRMWRGARSRRSLSTRMPSSSSWIGLPQVRQSRTGVHQHAHRHVPTQPIATYPHSPSPRTHTPTRPSPRTHTGSLPQAAGRCPFWLLLFAALLLCLSRCWFHATVAAMCVVRHMLTCRALPKCALLSLMHLFTPNSCVLEARITNGARGSTGPQLSPPHGSMRL